MLRIKVIQLPLQSLLVTGTACLHTLRLRWGSTLLNATISTKRLSTTLLNSLFALL